MQHPKVQCVSLMITPQTRFMSTAAFTATGRAVTTTARPSFVSPRSFFNWGKGDGAKGAGTPPQLQFQYHEDVELPFPMSLVSNTHLRDRELKCCYKATVDGFSATDFHRRCDFKGPCVVVGETAGGFRFGGFSPEGYRSTDDYYDTLDAFLFYWPAATGEAAASPPSLPVVLPKVGGSGAALFDYARGGPQFGADGKESLFGDETRAELAEVLVFCSPQIASLY